MDRLVDWFLQRTVPLNEHLFLIPDAKLLVVLTADKTKLVLRKVDIR